MDEIKKVIESEIIKLSEELVPVEKTADDVLKELARRFGVSGHDEKAARE